MRKRQWAAIATGMLLLVAVLGFAPRGTVHAAQASQQWVGVTGSFLGGDSGGGSYIDRIHNPEAPRLCLDVPGSRFYQNFGLFNTERDASGAQVQLFDCQPANVQHDNDRNQIWNQQDNGDGSWTYFVTGAQNFCLDSLGIQNLPGSAIEVEPCSGANSQKWTIGPDGELQSVDSAGECADINQATFHGDGNGAQVVLEPCYGQTSTAPAALASQSWASVYGTFLGLTSGGGSYRDHLHNAEAPAKCLDVPGSSFYQVLGPSTDAAGYATRALDPSGTQVQLFDCEPADAFHDGDLNQIWNQQDNGDGSWTYFVSDAHGAFFPISTRSYCLDSQGSQSSGSAVVVNHCTGANSQKWTIGPSGQLQSVDSVGYCADIDQATFQGDGNGAQVVLEPCSG